MSARKGDWIQTYTGRAYWPLDPRADEIDIEDIAHALSQICRYSGHCEYFYSVAEHSWHVSHMVPREHALAGLLHDGTEAYLLDMPRPVKRFMPEYQALEDLNWCVLASKFGLPEEMPASIKEADNGILMVEKQLLFGPEPMPWAFHAPLPHPPPVLHLWTSAIAKKRFLDRFDELTA